MTLSGSYFFSHAPISFTSFIFVSYATFPSSSFISITTAFNSVVLERFIICCIFALFPADQPVRYTAFALTCLGSFFFEGSGVLAGAGDDTGGLRRERDAAAVLVSQVGACGYHGGSGGFGGGDSRSLRTLSAKRGESVGSGALAADVPGQRGGVAGGCEWHSDLARGQAKGRARQVGGTLALRQANW